MLTTNGDIIKQSVQELQKISIKPFEYHHLGSFAYVGDNKAVLKMPIIGMYICILTCTHVHMYIHCTYTVRTYVCMYVCIDAAYICTVPLNYNFIFTRVMPRVFHVESAKIYCGNLNFHVMGRGFST